MTDQENKEKLEEYQRKYYQENKEKLKEYQKKYYQENPLRSLYDNIKQRCYNTKAVNFKDYGGRNITMCQGWLDSFEAFEKWCLDNNYRKGLEIDRIDNDGSYEPNNCQFITPAENTAIGKRRKRTNNTSGYVGVYFNKQSNKWMAYIRLDCKNIHLGCFDTPELALQARINKEIDHFGKQMTNLNLGEQDDNQH
jgi:hypothetical protein